MYSVRYLLLARRFAIMMILVGATLVPMIRCEAASTNAKKPKVAMVGITSDEEGPASAALARLFGDLLLSKISDNTPYEWVSRQESSQSKTNRELSVAGLRDPEIAAQLDLWKTCDYLLLGQLRFQSGTQPTLELEWTRPFRGELVGSLSVPLKHQGFTSRRDITDELPKIQSACIRWLKSLNDLNAGRSDSPSFRIIGTRSFPQVAPTGATNVEVGAATKELAELLRSGGSGDTDLSPRLPSLPTLGLYELDLLSRAYALDSRSAGAVPRSTLLVCLESSAASATPGSSSRLASNLTLLGLSTRGEFFRVSWTNLSQESLTTRLTDGSRALAQWASTGSATSGLPLKVESKGDAAVRSFAQAIQQSLGSSDRQVNVDSELGRAAWLNTLLPLQVASRLDPKNVELQKAKFRWQYLTPIGKSHLSQIPQKLELAADWMRLALDFYPEGSKSGISPAGAVAWMSPEELNRLFSVHSELLTWTRSDATKALPPAIRAELMARMEGRLVVLAQRAALLDPPSYGLSVFQWASANCRLGDSTAKLATLKHSVDARVAKAQAEEAQIRALLPRIEVTQTEPTEFHWESFYRVPPLLPAETKPRLEKAKFAANPELHGVVDMVWKDNFLWMIVHGMESRGSSKASPVQARTPDVFVPKGKSESWRLVRYAPDSSSYVFVEGFDSTQISQRMVIARNSVWLAGAKLVEVDPTKMKVLKILDLPPNFSGPVNQMTVGSGELYLASSRGSVASLNLQQGTWRSYSNLPPHLVTQIAGDTAASVGGLLFVSENEPFRLVPDGSRWMRLLFQHTNFPGWSVGTPVAVVRGQSNTVWIASNTGLFHYHLSHGYKDAWITPSPGFGNKSLDEIQSYVEKLRETLGAQYHPANSLTRFPGPIQRVIPDGEFLWVMCQAVDAADRDWVCALVHPASQKWVAHFRIPFLYHGDTAAVALRDKTLWFGGRTVGALRMLTKVDCTELYQTPRDSWVSLRVSREEAQAAVQRMSLDQQAFYHFADANYAEAIRALDRRSPLEESVPMEWVAALSCLGSSVNQPKRALHHVDNILAWEPPGSRWLGLAKTLRVEVESRIEALQFGVLPPLPRCPAASVQEFDDALLDTRFVRTLWKRFDANRNGKLDPEELLAITLVKDPIMERPFVYDWNHNLKLDPEEALIFFGVQKAVVEYWMRGLDKDHDGLISAEESGPPFCPEKLKPNEPYPDPNVGMTFREALQKVDDNHDSKISAAEVAYFRTKAAIKAFEESPRVLDAEMVGGATSRFDTNGNGKWDQAEIEEQMVILREFWRKQLNLPPVQRVQARP